MDITIFDSQGNTVIQDSHTCFTNVAPEAMYFSEVNHRSTAQKVVLDIANERRYTQLQYQSL